MRQGRFENGLNYAINRSNGAVAYCALSIKCGTRDEAGYNSGIAHFTEHSIFKGTAKKNANKINGYLDKLGGEINAYTTKEEIVIHTTTLKEDITKALKLLFELALEPTFPSKEIDIEKGVVLDEIISYKDSPSEEVYDLFEELLFEGHPLSNPILGKKASVKKISDKELLRFVKEKFLLNKMSISVVADIDEKSIESRIKKISESYSGNITCEREVINTDSVLISNKFDKTINKKNYQANCVLGGIAPSLYNEEERIAAILLCNILGGPATNSILNSSLRERNGWVYGVECSYTQYSDTGIAVICLGCDKEKLDKCLAAINKELLKLQSTPLSEQKLKAAKKQLLGQLAINSDNGESQCLSMGKSLSAYGRVLNNNETRMKIDSVSSEDIMKAAISIFDLNKISKLVFL